MPKGDRLRLIQGSPTLTPPAPLSSRAMEHYVDLMRNVPAEDVTDPTVTRLMWSAAVLSEQIEDCQQSIEDDGLIVEGNGGTSKANPAAQIMHTAQGKLAQVLRAAKALPSEDVRQRQQKVVRQRQAGYTPTAAASGDDIKWSKLKHE